MAVRSGFFNSVNGDRKYDARRFAEYFASFIGNGVFPNPSTNLQVVAQTTPDMTVIVRPGKAWINGYILINDDDYILQIDPADGVLNRIDRIVARYDTADREIRLEVKKGTFASSPVAPTLQRDADAYELGLADIYVAAGAVSIGQANITDLRMNSAYCGIVAGTVNQIDTTNLFAQYQAAFEEWFQELKDTLDENTAANLYNMISSHLADYANFRSDYEYQIPTIVGTQIRLEKRSNTHILKFKLNEDISDGAITISLDAGSTSKPLLDIEGNPVIELSKGFVEVIEDVDFFTYAPKGGAKLDEIIAAIEAKGGIIDEPKSISEVVSSINSSSEWESNFGNIILSPTGPVRSFSYTGEIGAKIDPVIIFNGRSMSAWSTGAWHTRHKINLTNKNSIVLECHCKNSGGHNINRIALCASSTITINESLMEAQISQTVANGVDADFTLTLDVSTLIGEFYILVLQRSNIKGLEVTLKNMYME